MKQVKKATPLQAVFKRVSKAVQERDEFLAKNRRILKKYDLLENRVAMVKFYAKEKAEMLVEEGKCKEGYAEYKDKFVEVRFQNIKKTGQISFDVFEKIRYAKKKK